jgi:transcriptional regulator with XRE-family HTH domain
MIQVKTQGGIGGCLRHLRKLLGWRQAELASATGMSATALSRIETGKVRPPVATVRSLLGILGFSSDAPRLIEMLMGSGFL